MKDQAQKLREIFNQHANKRRLRKTIAITSGKGGVGKTNFTVNLAIKLNQLGYKTIIIDADIGLANVDILLGVIPKYTLVDLLHSDKRLQDIIHQGPEGLKLIFGGSGIQELINPDIYKIKKLANSINQLEDFADIILIDTGAGLSETVLTFLYASDQIILITTPEPTSITDAYAIVKVLSNNNYDRPIDLVVNRSLNVVEARNVLDQFYNVADKFLKIKLQKLGYIIDDIYVSKAVKRQQPFSIIYPNCSASKCINVIANKIVNSGTGNIVSDGGLKSFFSRIIKLGKG